MTLCTLGFGAALGALLPKNCRTTGHDERLCACKSLGIQQHRSLLWQKMILVTACAAPVWPPQILSSETVSWRACSAHRNRCQPCYRVSSKMARMASSSMTLGRELRKLRKPSLRRRFRHLVAHMSHQTGHQMQKPCMCHAPRSQPHETE